MHTPFIPSLLVLSLMLASVLAGIDRDSIFAEDRIDWSTTDSQENVLVQHCDGFDITSSYTAEIAHRAVTDSTYYYAVPQEFSVDFAGSLGNTVTGKSYAYDGQFTRWFNYIENKFTITDAQLRFEVGTPGEFTFTVDRMKLGRNADPPALVEAIVPHVLQMELCYLMGAPVIAPVEPFDPIARYAPGTWINVQTETSALNPWANNQSGDDADACEPRRGYPHDC